MNYSSDMHDWVHSFIKSLSSTVLPHVPSSVPLSELRGILSGAIRALPTQGEAGALRTFLLVPENLSDAATQLHLTLYPSSSSPSNASSPLLLTERDYARELSAVQERLGEEESIEAHMDAFAPFLLTSSVPSIVHRHIHVSLRRLASRYCSSGKDVSEPFLAIPQVNDYKVLSLTSPNPDTFLSHIHSLISLLRVLPPHSSSLLPLSSLLDHIIGRIQHITFLAASVRRAQMLLSHLILQECLRRVEWNSATISRVCTRIRSALSYCDEGAESGGSLCGHILFLHILFGSADTYYKQRRQQKQLQERQHQQQHESNSSKKRKADSQSTNHSAPSASIDPILPFYYSSVFPTLYLSLLRPLSSLLLHHPSSRLGSSVPAELLRWSLLVRATEKKDLPVQLTPISTEIHAICNRIPPALSLPLSFRDILSDKKCLLGGQEITSCNQLWNQLEEKYTIRLLEVIDGKEVTSEGRFTEEYSTTILAERLLDRDSHLDSSSSASAPAAAPSSSLFFIDTSGSASSSSTSTPEEFRLGRRVDKIISGLTTVVEENEEVTSKKKEKGKKKETNKDQETSSSPSLTSSSAVEVSSSSTSSSSSSSVLPSSSRPSKRSRISAVVSSGGHDAEHVKPDDDEKAASALHPPPPTTRITRSRDSPALAPTAAPDQSKTRKTKRT